MLQEGGGEGWGRRRDLLAQPMHANAMYSQQNLERSDACMVLPWRLACSVRTFNSNSPVKAARSEQGRIQYIRPIGGSDADHHLVNVRLKAIQLSE